MPRRLRVNEGGYVYHVLNRANAGMQIFGNDADYTAFEKVLAQACERTKMRLLSYCIMPNHWHLLLWPRNDGDLSNFMAWMTMTHTQRWHAHHRTSGSGHLYQGRFKSFLVQNDSHFLTVCRYVERNALRAHLVQRAEVWRWCSLWLMNKKQKDTDTPIQLSKWPIERPDNWVKLVNEPQTDDQLQTLRLCVNRDRPFGSRAWFVRTIKKLDLQSTIRPPGRPRKKGKKGSKGKKKKGSGAFYAARVTNVLP